MIRLCLKWCLILLFISVWLLPAHKSEAAGPIQINAAGAALIDVASGRILYNKMGDTPMKIASLTKIMTAIVAIEHGNLSDMVKVGKNAYAKEGSSIYLKLGEEMSLSNMLYGLMLRSGNDAATAIAEHVGGSVEGFAYLMNEKAQLLGMAHSHFNNPSGLDDKGEHYASANDMAKLTAYALKNPIFQDIVKTRQKKVPNPNEKWDYVWFNKNKMLALFDGADGVKTGYTKLSRRCLVSSATRGGQQLVAVTLNDADDWADHAKMLQYGFQYFPLKPILGKGEKPAGALWAAGNSFSYPLLQEEHALISQRIIPLNEGTTDFRLGQRGSLQIMLRGEQIGSIPLFEVNDPRLQMPDTATFRFQASEQYRESAMEHYLRMFKMTLRKLLTWE